MGDVVKLRTRQGSEIADGSWVSATEGGLVRPTKGYEPIIGRTLTESQRKELGLPEPEPGEVLVAVRATVARAVEGERAADG